MLINWWAGVQLLSVGGWSVMETCAGTQELFPFPFHIPHCNFISLTLPHPPGYSHFPPHSLTHYSSSPFTHVPRQQNNSICMVLNKSAKVQTYKCNNILSESESSKSRTCHGMHCEGTANCQLSRQKAACGVPPGFAQLVRMITLYVK